MVLMPNVAVVCPADTTTELGTVAATFPVDKAMVVPPAPAGPERVTVPVEELPPCIDGGLRLSEETVAGVIASVAD